MIWYQPIKPLKNIANIKKIINKKRKKKIKIKNTIIHIAKQLNRDFIQNLDIKSVCNKEIIGNMCYILQSNESFFLLTLRGTI
jgi:hypothetical protein